MSLLKKLRQLSAGLRRKIIKGGFDFTESPETPVSNFLVKTKKHCNGGIAIRAALKAKAHCDKGGKLFITMAGAASTFEMGILIAALIRQDKVAAISVTGANLEESLYRLVGYKHYAYIPDFLELTIQEEKELDNVELRRITGTFLPEEESVRIVLPKLEKRWRHAEKTGKYLFWHEYFFELFEHNMINVKNNPHLEDCWLYWAWKHGVEIIVGGAEDSTMGNIFSHASYTGNHPFLSKYKLEKPIKLEVIRHSFAYMHRLAEWYMNNTKDKGLVFLQLGGSIAGDFPICVIPHLKKDFLHNLTIAEQEKYVRPLAGFIEIHLTPMSGGSYGGAGYKEKITWGKLDTKSWGAQIYGDFTNVFPDIAGIILGL